MAQQNPSQAPILSNPIPQAGSTPGLARLALLTLLSTTTVQPTTKVCEKCQQDDTATEGDRERRQVPKIEYCQLDQTNAPHVIRFTSKQMNDHLRGNFHQPAQAFLRFVKKNGGGQYQPEPDSKYKAKYRYKCGWCSLALPKNYQLEKHVLEKHLGEFPKEGPVREYIVACGTDKVKACQGECFRRNVAIGITGRELQFPKDHILDLIGDVYPPREATGRIEVGLAAKDANDFFATLDLFDVDFDCDEPDDNASGISSFQSHGVFNPRVVDAKAANRHCQDCGFPGPAQDLEETSSLRGLPGRKARLGRTAGLAQYQVQGELTIDSHSLLIDSRIVNVIVRPESWSSIKSSVPTKHAKTPAGSPKVTLQV